MPEPLVASFVMTVKITYRVFQESVSFFLLIFWMGKDRGRTMENDMPAAPNIMRLRLPNFSMVKTAIQDAMKYSERIGG